jgi:Dyp-type peroxidase family
MTRKAPLYELNRQLTEEDFQTYRAALSCLQGNILKSHGREATINVFLTFKPDKQLEVKQFLAEFSQKVTSAFEQEQQTQRRRKHPEISEHFANLFLSAKGYEYLDTPTKGFSREFLSGMEAAELNDPPVSKWEPQFQKDLHAMALLAHDSVEDLTREHDWLRKRVRDIAHVSSERGNAIENATGVIEHFGYLDGRSQPLFFSRDMEKETKRFWDPSAGPSLVLVRDPPGGSDEACGTYFVFRKLEQNVRGFRLREEALAKQLKLSGEDEELAGAMVVGRFEDGTPVATDTKANGKRENDFAYSIDDPNGNKCPFSAHIRLVNARRSSVEEKAHRIARRGITYGDPAPWGEDLDALPEKGVGLLFQCCQADLANQFEFLQKASGVNDPVSGQSPNGRAPEMQFPRPWGSHGRKSCAFHGFVTMMGGEYFFAPSKYFLERLKQ